MECIVAMPGVPQHLQQLPLCKEVSIHASKLGQLVQDPTGGIVLL